MKAKVLHMWVGDSPLFGGGGAGAMFRLHSNLRKEGVDSSILCEKKTSGDPQVFTKPAPTRLESLLKNVTGRIGLNDIHRVHSWKIAANEHFRKADLLNFQGIHSGFLNYLALPALTAAKPSVFTMHDMWCFTGHCAVSFDCSRWKSGCGQCPYPKSYPPVRRDATATEWKLKKWAFGRSRLTLVAVSRWLAEQARQSFLGNFDIQTIYNGVDTQAYQPLDQALARAAFDIPQDSKVLMFSAVNLNNRAKGGDLLLQALSALPPALKRESFLLTMGSNGRSMADAAGLRGIDLGYVSSHRLKSLAFSAADLFVFPSRGEALGQVVLESLACGTPVVAQDLGPMPEMVRPGRTGLLAAPENPQELMAKIVALLKDARLRERCGKNGRRMVVEEFSTELETSKYIDLYRRMMANEGGGGAEA